MVELILGAIAIFTLGAFCGGAGALAFGYKKQIEVLTNLVEYRRPTKPKASVYEPSSSDPEVEATIILREREHDTLVKYLEGEGISRKDSADEAAAMMRHLQGGT